MGNYINTNDLELEVSYYLQCEKESEAITLEELKEITNRLPSADVVEVKHGEWIGKSECNYVNCSECGVDFSKMTGKEFRFCPICGTRMTNFGLRYKDKENKDE